MQAYLGLFMIFAGMALGLYVGVWWAFIGGIVDVINQIKAPEVNALALAIGVAKFVFAATIGWFAALVLILPGKVMLDDA